MMEHENADLNKKNPNVKLIIALGIILLLAINMFFIYKLVNISCENPHIEDSDAVRFKKEYESLNGALRNDTDYYLEVSINENNPIVYASMDEIIDTLSNGTGIILFGFKECPWCRNLIPNLVDVLNELGIEKVLYWNDQHIRDTLTIDDGIIVTEQEGTSEYYKLLELLGDNAHVYSGLNDPTIKRVYFPSIIYVKNGVVRALHQSTLDSQTDPYTPLTDEQREELKNTLKNEIGLVYPGKCSINEAC